MADMMMPEGMPMDPMMGGGMPPAEGMPMDPMMGGGMPPMDMMPPEGEAPMEEMGDELAEEGRGGDQIVGHLTPGEIVIPVEMLDEELMEILDEFFAENGLPMGQYTVGHEENSINPETGMPEFFMGGYDGMRFNDPRRNWAERESYWGYSGVEQPVTAKQEFGISMADWNRFNEYMSTYQQKRIAETGSDAKGLSEEMAKWGIGYRTNNLYTKVLQSEMKGENKYNYDWMKQPRWKSLVKDAKAASPAAFRNAMNFSGRTFNETMQAQYDDRVAYERQANLRKGNLVMADWQNLSALQKAGPWRHAEQYSGEWGSMKEKEKRKVFEDFMRKLKFEQDAAFAGVWGGAGSAYGKLPKGGFESTKLMGPNPYIPMDAEAQAAYDALSPEQIAYRTASQEGSVDAMAQFRAEQMAQQEVYLEQLRVQLEAERMRAMEERKRALGKQARLNRLKGKTSASTFSNTAAAEAAGSITDPRSMIGRSYSRRSAYSGGSTLTGFRTGNVGGFGAQRPS